MVRCSRMCVSSGSGQSSRSSRTSQLCAFARTLCAHRIRAISRYAASRRQCGACVSSASSRSPFSGLSPRPKTENDPERIPGRSCSRSASQDARTAPIAAASDSRVMGFATSSATAGTLGGLIQTAVGSGFGEGRPFGNRSGCRANASASTRARLPRFAAASP